MEPERTQEQIDRLKALQMADLGIVRRDKISAYDDTPSRFNVGVEQLEARRASNIRGSEAQKQATKDKSWLDGWKNLHKTINDVPSTEANLDELMNGQSHRAALSASMDRARFAPHQVFPQGRTPEYEGGVGKRPRDDEALSAHPYGYARPTNTFARPAFGSGVRLDPALDINNGGIAANPRGRGGRGKPKARPNIGLGIGTRNGTRGGNPFGIGPGTRGPQREAPLPRNLQAMGNKAPKSVNTAAKAPVRPKPPLDPRYAQIVSPEEFLADIRKHGIRFANDPKPSSSATTAKEASQPAKNKATEKTTETAKMFQFSTQSSKATKKPGSEPVFQFSAAPSTPTPIPRGTIATTSSAVTAAKTAMKSQVEVITEEIDSATSLMTLGGKRRRRSRTIAEDETPTKTSSNLPSAQSVQEQIVVPHKDDKMEPQMMSSVKKQTPASNNQPEKAPASTNQPEGMKVSAALGARKATAPASAPPTIQQTLARATRKVSFSTPISKVPIGHLIDTTEAESSKVAPLSQGAAQLKGISFPTADGNKPAPAEQSTDMSPRSSQPPIAQKVLRYAPTHVRMNSTPMNRPVDMFSRSPRPNPMSFQELLDYFPNPGVTRPGLEERLGKSSSTQPLDPIVMKALGDLKQKYQDLAKDNKEYKEELARVSAKLEAALLMNSPFGILEKKDENVPPAEEIAKSQAEQLNQGHSVTVEEQKKNVPRSKVISPQREIPQREEDHAPMTPLTFKQKETPDSFAAYRSPKRDSSSDEKTTPSSKGTQGTNQEKFYDAQDVTPSPEVSSAPKKPSEIQLGKRPMGSSSKIEFRKASLFESKPVPENSATPTTDATDELAKSLKRKMELAKSILADPQKKENLKRKMELAKSIPADPQKENLKRKMELAKSIHADPRKKAEILAEAASQGVVDSGKESKRAGPKVLGPQPCKPIPKPKPIEQTNVPRDEHLSRKPLKSSAEIKTRAVSFDTRSPNMLHFNPDRPRWGTQQTGSARDGHDAFQYSEMRAQIDSNSNTLAPAAPTTTSLSRRIMSQGPPCATNTQSPRKNDRSSDERRTDENKLPPGKGPRIIGPKPPAPYSFKR